MCSEMVSMEILNEILFGTSNNVTNQDYVRILMDNQTNTTFSFQSELHQSHTSTERAVLILAYSILAVISIFGNSLVCYVICKNKRLYTPTNFFLANLAVSDLLITCINIPFNIARNLLTEWPFGDILCHLVNFSLIVSVYVSTYTLTVIALDRHRVIVEPFNSKMSKTSSLFILLTIWLLAISLALPYGIYNTVEEVTYFVATVKRCHSRFPSGVFEQYLSVVTLFLQYFVPLTIIGIAYGRIVHKLWLRTHVGAVTEYQQMSQARSKRKSIKLLIAVVIVFALCWLPINLYHILTDFHPDVEVFHYNSRVFFICHWIAVSSTCYHPFVYCWLNENFRREVLSRFFCDVPKFDLITALGIFWFRCHKRQRTRPVSSSNSGTRTSLGSLGRTIKVLERESSNTTEREDILNMAVNGNFNGTIQEDNLEEAHELLPNTVLLTRVSVRDNNESVQSTTNTL